MIILKNIRVFQRNVLNAFIYIYLYFSDNIINNVAYTYKGSLVKKA